MYTLDNVIKFLHARKAELNRQHCDILSKYSEVSDLLEHFEQMSRNEKENINDIKG